MFIFLEVFNSFRIIIFLYIYAEHLLIYFDIIHSGQMAITIVFHRKGHTIDFLRKMRTFKNSF